MARSTTGSLIEREKSLPRLPADHPLFKRGFVVGMQRSGSYSTTGQTPKPGSPPPAPETEEGLAPAPGSAAGPGPRGPPTGPGQIGRASCRERV